MALVYNPGPVPHFFTLQIIMCTTTDIVKKMRCDRILDNCPISNVNVDLYIDINNNNFIRSTYFHYKIGIRIRVRDLT